MQRCLAQTHFARKDPELISLERIKLLIFNFRAGPFLLEGIGSGITSSAPTIANFIYRPVFSLQKSTYQATPGSGSEISCNSFTPEVAETVLQMLNYFKSKINLSPDSPGPPTQ